MTEKQENPNSTLDSKVVTSALNSLFSNKQNPDFEKVVKYILPNNYYKGQDFLLVSILEYLYYEAPDNKQNLSMVVELTNAGIKKGGEEEYGSDLDRLFSLLQEKDENHIALKHYKKFYSISGDKADFIFISCAKYFSNLFGDVIKQIYEEVIIKLPEDHIELEKIHNATNGESLYEQFGFKPDEIGFNFSKNRVLLTNLD